MDAPARSPVPDDDGPWTHPRLREVPVFDHTGGGKASQYHPRIGAVICARMEVGETIASITADPAMPAYCTVFQWVKMNPDFAVMYRRMREKLAVDKIDAAAGRRQARAWRRAHEVKLGLRRQKHGGKKSTYSLAVARRFCARVAKGEILMSIVADPAMPSFKAVYGWLRREPQFAAMYVAARAEQRRWLEFQIEMAVDQATTRGLAWAKARVAHLEGRIGRLTPKTYRALPKGWPKAAPVAAGRPEARAR